MNRKRRAPAPGRWLPLKSVRLPGLSFLLGRGLWWTGRISSGCIVRAIALTLPKRKWYPAVWQICRVQMALIGPLIRFTSYRDDHRRRALPACLLNHWIVRFLHVRRDFPIPMEIRGAEIAQAAFANPNGVLVCSAHVPLMGAILRALVLSGCSPSAVIASGEVITSRRTFCDWGEEFPGLVNDSLVLVKLRSLLRRGGSAVTLVDLDLCESYSPNALRMVTAAGARLVFAVPELQADGRLLFDFLSPPDPSCCSAESILTNLLFLKARVDRILVRPGQPESSAAAVAGSLPSPLGPAMSGRGTGSL